MSRTLLDITLYYDGDKIKDVPHDWAFRQTLNFIADFYHHSLNGYKPQQTSRICVHLESRKKWDKPIYFGAICNYDTVIDESKYLSLSKKEQYSYVLDLLHTTVSEIATFENWDQSVFDSAYKHILDNDFQFVVNYPEKKSKDKKHIGKVVLRKTETRSILYVEIIKEENSLKSVILLEKRNMYCYDFIYSLARQVKWLNKDLFGLHMNEKNCYFSILDNKVVCDLSFESEELSN